MVFVGFEFSHAYYADNAKLKGKKPTGIKFDTEALLTMMTKKVLEPVGYDYSGIKIRAEKPAELWNTSETGGRNQESKRRYL